MVQGELLPLQQEALAICIPWLFNQKISNQTNAIYLHLIKPRYCVDTSPAHQAGKAKKQKRCYCLAYSDTMHMNRDLHLCTPPTWRTAPCGRLVPRQSTPIHHSTGSPVRGLLLYSFLGTILYCHYYGCNITDAARR
jgi:hypothetical protein